MEGGVVGDAGGIATLRELIAQHPEAVEYDLIRLGRRLRDVPSLEFDWRDLFVLVTQAQQGTATFSAFVPDWQHTHDVELLRSVDYYTRVGVWFQTRDGQRGRNRPEPYKLPWDPEPERDTAFDADILPRHELDRIIGWD